MESDNKEAKELNQGHFVPEDLSEAPREDQSKVREDDFDGERQQDGMQHTIPSSCPPSRYGEGANQGNSVPRNHPVGEILTQTSQSGGRTLSEEMTEEGEEDELRTGEDNKNTSESDMFKESSESDNSLSHGTEGGPTKSAQPNAPHVPRVDTWWGLSQVAIVPTNIVADLTTETQQAAETSEEAEMMMESEEHLQSGPGQGKASPQPTSHTTPESPESKPFKPYKSRAKPESNRAVRANAARHFYQRRRKKREKRKQQQSQDRTEILSSSQSVSNKRNVNSEISNFINPQKNQQSFTGNKFSEMTDSNASSANSSVASGVGNEGHQDTAEKLLDSLVEGLEAEMEVEEKQDGKGEAKAKKGRNPRKEWKCDVEGCDFAPVKIKTKFEKHLKEKHGLETKKSTPKPTPNQSAENSPAIGAGKKRVREDAIEESRELRQKLEKLQQEEVEVSEEEKQAKAMPEGINMTNELVKAGEKIKQLEKQLSRKAQETEDARTKLISVEMERDEYFEENEKWKKKANTIIMGASVRGQSESKLQKELDEAKMDVERYKQLTRLQNKTLVQATKQYREAQDKVTHLQKRTICRDFEKGRCSRKETCKFAHVLPTAEDTLLQGAVLGAQGGLQGANNETVSMMVAVENKPKNNSCLYFERGYCKFGAECKKVHDKDKYGTRPRSGSHGSNTMKQTKQGFQQRLKKKGDLGTINVLSPQFPEFADPAMDNQTTRAQIRELDEAAKGPYKEAEKMMIQQLKELQVLLAVTGQEQRNNIFPSKRD